jgi:hypothetical protein
LQMVVVCHEKLFRMKLSPQGGLRVDGCGNLFN